MQSSRPFRHLAICLLAIISISCGPRPENQQNAANTSANQSAANKANNNAEELGMLINFQLEPEDLIWRADETKKTIVAVMHFDPPEATKLKNDLAAKAQGSPRSVTTEEWFPPELVAQGEAAGNSSISGTVFPATDFYLAPYTEGTITHITDTEFFVLELVAK
jgi:hypothetical protein